MKIAIYANEIPSTVFIENLIKGLAERGHEIYVYGKYKKNPHYEKHRNIHILKEPISKIQMVFYALKYIFKFLFTAPKTLIYLLKTSKDKTYLSWIYRFNLYATIVHLEVAIFHIQWVNSIVYIDTLIENKLAKTVVSLRGTHLNVTPLYQEECKQSYVRLFPKIDGFHAVSHAIINEAKKYDATVEERAHVAYPAVTDSTLSKFTIAKKRNEGVFKVVSIGRHHWKKGYTYAFDAIKILKDNNIPVEYTIVAQGTLDERLLHQIKELEIQDCIIITGGLSHDKVLEKVQKSDVFLLPSLEEGVANVVLEAMAVGTIVVSSDCGGMLEVIKEGVNGYITKSGYAEQLAESLLKVYQLNEDESVKMITNAYETIVAKHTLNTQLNEMEILYQNVIQS
ncbi:MAG: glycosyltransferase family 4 protein [Bacteroidota bacterium]|nr:glycosyltransferase family 4 protein [Bacteroidota bacterium]